MVKNVKFSDRVNIKYMDISLADHSMEVKNPTGGTAVIINNDGGGCLEQLKTLPSTISSFHTLCWIFVIFIFIIVWWLLWKFYRKKPNNSESEN
jgi:disulfide bond formation protein DsbB